MTDDVKKLGEKIDIKFKQVKDLVEIVVKKIGKVEKQQVAMSGQIGSMSGQIGSMSGQIGSISAKQSVIEEKLDGHTLSLMKIEATLEGYADMYKVNKEKNEELEERVDIIEEQLGASKNN